MKRILLLVLGISILMGCTTPIEAGFTIDTKAVEYANTIKPTKIESVPTATVRVYSTASASARQTTQISNKPHQTPEPINKDARETRSSRFPQKVIASDRGYHMVLDDTGVVWSWISEKTDFNDKIISTESTNPTRSSTLHNIVSIDVDRGYCFAVTNNGNLYAWQLSYINETKELTVGDIHLYEHGHIFHVDIFSDYALVLLNDGSLLLWEYGVEELRSAKYIDIPLPIQYVKDGYIIDSIGSCYKLSYTGNINCIWDVKEENMKAISATLGFHAPVVLTDNGYFQRINENGIEGIEGSMYNLVNYGLKAVDFSRINSFIDIYGNVVDPYCDIIYSNVLNAIYIEDQLILTVDGKLYTIHDTAYVDLEPNDIPDSYWFICDDDIIYVGDSEATLINAGFSINTGHLVDYYNYKVEIAPSEFEYGENLHSYIYVGQ